MPLLNAALGRGRLDPWPRLPAAQPAGPGCERPAVHSRPVPCVSHPRAAGM